jgi:cysteine-rich repeat protein
MKNQKLIVICVAGFLALVIGYVGLQGNIWGLRSDVIGANAVCSVSQGEYDAVVSSKAQLVTQKKNHINTIDESNRAIQSKNPDKNKYTRQVSTAKNTVNGLQDFINKNCKWRLQGSSVCNSKRKDLSNAQKNLNDAQKNLKGVNDAITALQTTISTSQGEIRNIDKKIADADKVINKYKACPTSVLTVSSPTMSGEISLKWNIGERVNIYNFSMGLKNARPQTISGEVPIAPARIETITFETSLFSDTISLSDWNVRGPGVTPYVYPCTFIENGDKLRCTFQTPTEQFVVWNMWEQQFVLSAVISNMTGTWSFKIYKVSKGGIVYNGNKNETENTTTLVKYNYGHPPVCGNNIVEPGEQCDDGNTNNNDWCSNSCIDYPIHLTCGNGTIEWIEQCDDGNTSNDDGCSKECTVEWSYPWYIMTTDKQEYGNGDTIILEMSSVTGVKWFVDLYVQPYKWYGSENGVLIQRNIEINRKNTYKIKIPDYPKIFDETDNYLLVISGAGQAKKPENINSMSVNVSVPAPICESLLGDRLCLAQDGCYYDEKTSKCTSTVLTCEDAVDAGDEIFTKWTVWGFAHHVYSPRYRQASYDYCTGATLNQVSCDSAGFAKYTQSVCPGGCSDGVCKTACGAATKEIFATKPTENLCVTWTVLSTEVFFDPSTTGSNGNGSWWWRCRETAWLSTGESCWAQSSTTWQSRLEMPTLNLRQTITTPAQYIATSGSSDATSKINFSFASTGGISTITELKFTISGSNPNSVSSIKVNDISSSVVNNVGDIRGLNIPIWPADPDNNNAPELCAILDICPVNVLVSYPSVGEGSVPSGTTSKVTLTYVKYISNDWTVHELTPSVSAPTMTLVGSAPIVFINQTDAPLRAWEIKALEISVIANTKWNISLLSFPLVVEWNNITLNPDMSKIKIRDESWNIIPINSELLVKNTNNVFLPVQNGTLVSEGKNYIYISFTNPSGYGIPAWYIAKFMVYIPVTALWNNGELKTSLWTTADWTGNFFVWNDIFGNNSFGGTENILNYPTNIISIKN